jgi:hypothetical protein
MLRTWRPARFEALAKRGRVHWVQDLFDGRQLEPRRKQKCSTARPHTKFLTLPVVGIIARIEVGAEAPAIASSSPRFPVGKAKAL